MLSSVNILPRSPWGGSGGGGREGDSTTSGPGLLLSLLPLSSPLLYGFVWPHKSSLPAQLPRSLLCQASDSLPSGPHSSIQQSHTVQIPSAGASLWSLTWGTISWSHRWGKKYRNKKDNKQIVICLFHSLSLFLFLQHRLAVTPVAHNQSDI